MPHDLYAEIDQTAVDKLLDSTGYPLALMDKNQPFPGCDSVNLQHRGFTRIYDDSEIDQLFEEADSVIGKGNKAKTDIDFHLCEQIYTMSSDIISQIQMILNNGYPTTQGGPAEADLEKIVSEGVSRLPSNLRPLGDVELRAWCSHLGVTLNQRPALQLASPRIILNNLRVAGSAAGELWFKHPWLVCCPPRVVSKCDRIASLSVTIDVAADTHIDLSTSGAKVFAKGSFDKLRLDYPILRDIPLEGLANQAMGEKTVLIYDASKLVETIPILNSRFSVSRLTAPPFRAKLESGNRNFKDLDRIFCSRVKELTTD